MAEIFWQDYLIGNKERIYRHGNDPFATLTEEEIKSRYRFSREGIEYLCGLLGPILMRATRRSRALTVRQQVCAALRFYACGSFQEVLGDTLGISQPSVSRAVTQVTQAILEAAEDFIKLPTTDAERRKIKEKFYNLANFPNVVGLIDGTHIRIQGPRDFEPVYVNRKQFHSINVQIVCGPEQEILDVCARWPGSTHDSRVLRGSGLFTEFEHGMMRNSGILLGDSGYPVRKWLMTPLLGVNNEAEEKYNRAHKSTRCLVERTIGVLKRTFGCLHGELRFSPEKCCAVIVACCVLHNLRKQLGLVDEDENLDEDDADRNLDDEDNDVAAGNGMDGFQARRDLINQHFTDHN